jgi:hypothetical protein
MSYIEGLDGKQLLAGSVCDFGCAGLLSVSYCFYRWHRCRAVLNFLALALEFELIATREF